MSTVSKMAFVPEVLEEVQEKYDNSRGLVFLPQQRARGDLSPIENIHYQQYPTFDRGFNENLGQYLVSDECFIDRDLRSVSETVSDHLRKGLEKKRSQIWRTEVAQFIFLAHVLIHVLTAEIMYQLFYSRGSKSEFELRASGFKNEGIELCKESLEKINEFEARRKFQPFVEGLGHFSHKPKEHFQYHLGSMESINCRCRR